MVIKPEKLVINGKQYQNNHPDAEGQWLWLTYTIKNIIQYIHKYVKKNIP